MTVLDRMKQAGVYDENTSLPYLTQLMEITPTAANVLEYADIVADKALLRGWGRPPASWKQWCARRTARPKQILEGGGAAHLRHPPGPLFPGRWPTSPR